MAKRCLIVTYYFPPLGGGGVQRMVKLSKYLHRAGWQVTVVTADEPGIPVEKDETLLQEIPQSAKIIHIPADLPFVRQNKNAELKNNIRSSYFKRWISAFLFIPDIRKAWIKPAKQAVLQELQKEKYDCILVSSPPYSLALLAGELTDEATVPVILDMRDPWTINPFKIHPTFFHRLLDQRLERKAVSTVNYGISVTKDLLSYYGKTIRNFKKENWRYIPNGYDEEDFSFAEVEPSLPNDNFNIAFLGTFYSHLNKPDELFTVFSLINKEQRNLSKKLCFHHIGKAHIDLKKMAIKYGLEEQIVLHGYLPHRQALAVLNKMDAFCLVYDSRNPKSRYTIGSKLYEYLRLRKPILAMIPEDSEAAQIIRQADAGTVIESTEHHKAAETLKHWMDNPPAYSFKEIEQYSRTNQARAFIEFFEEIIR